MMEIISSVQQKVHERVLGRSAGLYIPVYYCEGECLYLGNNGLNEGIDHSILPMLCG